MASSKSSFTLFISREVAISSSILFSYRVSLVSLGGFLGKQVLGAESLSVASIAWIVNFEITASSSLDEILFRNLSHSSAFLL
jgi:hypothetical protein